MNKVEIVCPNCEDINTIFLNDSYKRKTVSVRCFRCGTPLKRKLK